MARGVLPITTLTNAAKTAVAPAAEVTGDASNGHTVQNSDGKTMLLVHNTNGASTARTLTIAVTKTVDGQAVAARTYSIGAGLSRWVGGFEVADYGKNLLIDVSHAELVLSAYHA